MLPTPSTDALAGLQVLDFTIVMSGPMCTRMLADVGADSATVGVCQGSQGDGPK